MPSKAEIENKQRLITILSKIPAQSVPDSWQYVTTAAISGFVALGFSPSQNYLLIVSNSGRGLFDCQSGEKIARDYQELGDWFNESTLLCQGIDKIAHEQLFTAGIYGGGLPTTTCHGESLTLASPNWPLHQLYFCQNYKSALFDGHQDDCIQLCSDYIDVYGFSGCGNFLVVATSSDFTLWKRQ